MAENPTSLNYYTYLQICFLSFMTLLELYVIVWRLRFRLDRAAYLILLTYLACMAARILLTL